MPLPDPPKPLGWIARHFSRYGRFGPLAFTWRITIEGLAVSLLAGLVVGLVVGEETRDLPKQPLAFVALVVVIAPVLETFLLQALPMELTRIIALRSKRPWFAAAIAASTILFTLAHVLEGIGTAISAGLVGGIYLSFTYAHWRSRSFRLACLTTIGSHGIRNFMAFLLLAAQGYF